MSNGKTIAIVLVICGCLGILAVGSLVGLVYLGFRSANASVAPTIDRLFAAIDSDTFAETYETETTPEFRQVTSKEQYTDIGKAIATRLGPLKKKSLRGFNMRQQNADSLVDVTYSATFEKGSGTIVTRMKRQGGQWRIVMFRVNSPLFEQDLATLRCAKCGAPHARSARFCPACGAKIGSDDPAVPAAEQPADQ